MDGGDLCGRPGAERRYGGFLSSRGTSVGSRRSPILTALGAENRQNQGAKKEEKGILGDGLRDLRRLRTANITVILHAWFVLNAQRRDRIEHRPPARLPKAQAKATQLSPPLRAPPSPLASPQLEARPEKATLDVERDLEDALLARSPQGAPVGAHREARRAHLADAVAAHLGAAEERLVPLPRTLGGPKDLSIKR
nr:hypothetical protein CFP56_11239 [Quercus suber]